MKIEELQAQIDSTNYWDAEILDFEIKYFGDEVSILIENDDDTVWRLTFLTCLNVSYETDATWRGFYHVKEMTRSHMCYFGQSISVLRNEEDDSFIDAKMDLSVMTVEITFQDILLEKIPRDSISLFYAE